MEPRYETDLFRELISNDLFYSGLVDFRCGAEDDFGPPSRPSLKAVQAFFFKAK